MHTWIRSARRAVLGAAVAASLGFGATQALAAPEAEAPRQGCNLVDCDRLCRTLGYPGGLCSRGSCFCYR